VRRHLTVVRAPRIRVLVAEDEQPLRDAICDLIHSEAGMEVVGAASSAADAVAIASTTQPDVALVDVRMPGGGARAASEIRLSSPDTRIVGLSAYEDQATVLEMLRAGAVGYLVKGISPAEVLEAIQRAARGQASLSVEVIAGVLDALVGDLDERGNAMAVLRRSEEKFRSLVESAPDAVVIVDDEGRIQLVNAQTEELFGYGRAELLGEPVEILLPEHFREQHVAHRARYIADPQTRPMGAGLDLAGRRSDGSEFPADISLSTIDTVDGRLVTARVRDITELKRTQDVRRRSEERFAALLESAPDAVVIADAEGRIVLVNHQTETLFGYQRDELLGRFVETLLPERFRKRHVGHRAGYLAAPATRPMGAGLELAGRRKDGSEFPVDVSLSTIEMDEGTLVTTFVRDVTERVAAEQLQRDLVQRRALLAHLVKAGEEERRRIADDIHDDSIQAITAAGMRLQILRRSLEDPEQLELLGELEQTIQLSISRLRHLLFELRPPVLDNEGLGAALGMYLDETADEVETRYELENSLTSQPSAEVRVILYRITQEALTNARKHAQAENVRVVLREREGGYLVRVADDGVGFVPEAGEPAVGHLGLASMRERATLAGGSLRVEAAPGRGTTVEVWIPALPGRSDAAAAAQPGGEEARETSSGAAA
jgi:PAS domain S-box-containing protein